ncbi:MAG: hypothetical protein QOF57_363, partial [Frankiaceae bacterium]|nr:hypothetical protein [Frankiaceae bacterium]
MTSVRRSLLPFAAFAVVATAWSAVNIGLYDASVRHTRTIQAIELTTVNASQLAAGRPLLPPSDPSYYPMGWAVDWRMLGPGLLLLAGAAVFSALLRRSVRGPWWVAALVAPAFTAGFASMKQAWAYGAAGAGTTAYATTYPTPQSLPRSVGVHFPYFPSPSWLLPAMTALGVLVVLAPALCVGTRVTRTEKAPGQYFWTRAFVALRAFGAAPVVPAVAATLGVLAVQMLTSDTVALTWRGPVGAAPLVLAIALVLRSLPLRADRLTTAPWLVLAVAGLVAGTTGVAAGQLATAVGAGAL